MLLSVAPSNPLLSPMNDIGIGPYGIIAIILILFAVTGFFRGLINTTLTVVCLAISGYCAYWMHQNVYQLISPWVSNPQPRLCGLIAVVAGLAAFILCRYIFRFLIEPFNVSKTGQRIGFGFPAAFITFCVGFIFIWLSLAGIRYLGSAAEVQRLGFQLKSDDEQHETWDLANQHIIPHFISTKQWLNESSLGKLHLQSDPFHTSGKIKLSKILIYYHHKQSRLEMLKKSELNPILNDAVFLELAHTEAIKDVSASDYPIGILSSKHIATALKNPKLSAELGKLSSEDIDTLSSS